MEQFIQLSDHVVSAKTVNTFKNRLDRFWSNQDVLYDYRGLEQISTASGTALL